MRLLRRLLPLLVLVLFTSITYPQALPSNVNYSTLFGGALEDRITAAVSDTNGNIWVVGSTRSSDLPGTDLLPETHVPSHDSDAFVAKFSPSGELLFARYLGGTADDEARGVAVDSNGNALVVGTTSSSEFPSQESNPPLWRAFIAYVSADGQVIRPQRLPAGAVNAIAVLPDGEFWVVGETETVAHAWVAKVRNPGEGYIEVLTPQEFGTATDTALAVAVDASGNGYVTGATSSTAFPTTTGAPQTALAGSKDAFLMKLSPDATLLFSTYFGDSSGETTGRALALNAQGDVFITGVTTTSTLPMADTAASSGMNAFVAHFSDAGLLSSRFLGGSGTDEGNGIALDKWGSPVIAGKTNSTDFISSFYCSYGPCFDVFIFTPYTPGISARIGGQEVSMASSAASDSYGNLFVAGSTRSPAWPVTENAYQRNVLNDDGFVMRYAAELDPPTVNCDSPVTGIWSAVDVEVNCDAMDYGTGLANATDSHFTLKTDVTAGTETSNAETDSRKVCDHSGNCTPAGPYGGLLIDKKAPVISFNLKARYMQNEPAIADYSCIDQNGSGVKSCTGPVAAGASLDTSKTGTQTFTVAAVDEVGNENIKSVTYDVAADTTAPANHCAVPDQLWHKETVTIACTAEDGGSGLVNPSDANFLLTAAVLPGVETPNAQTDSRSICDKAGNCTTAGPIAGIHIDSKAPVLTRSGLLGATTSWSANDVSVQYTSTDGGSGLANMADAIFSISTSVADATEVAAAATNRHTVCDNVGNCATAGPENFNIDKKAPSVAIAVPNGHTYLLNAAVTADFSCADGGSGISSCYSPAGNLVQTSFVGSANFVVKAIDKVGHNASLAATYQVIYQLDLGYDPAKAIKGGTFPIKLQLTDVNGVNRSASSIVLTAVAVSNSTRTASVPASGTFRYDPKLFRSGGYILNLDTSGLAPGSYALVFKAGADAYLYSVPFGVR